MKTLSTLFIGVALLFTPVSNVSANNFNGDGYVQYQCLHNGVVFGVVLDNQSCDGTFLKKWQIQQHHNTGLQAGDYHRELQLFDLGGDIGLTHLDEDDDPESCIIQKKIMIF